MEGGSIMVSMLAAIEWGKLPWTAAMFALDHWKTAVAATWGLGFAYILFKNMRVWVKQDAYDASIGKKDEGEIYDGIKEIAKTRRGERIKQVLTKMLFWMPLMAMDFGKKIAKVVFYPVLAYLDKAQTEAIKNGKVGKPLNPSFAPADDQAGPGSVKCQGCGLMMPITYPHVCAEAPVVPSSPVPQSAPVVKQAIVECNECGNAIAENSVHTCDAKLEANGMVKCSCGAVYRDEEDFDHMCPEEEVSVSDVQCKDCSRNYNPADEVHAAAFCRGCSDVHCRKHNCGKLVSV